MICRLHPIPPAESSTAYGRPFWLAYVANTLVMVAVALLFRYADFITLLGGTELNLGWIVGVGMVGSLAMRLLLGVSIDHYGPRVVWVGSVALFAVCCFAHLGITSCHGPAIYAVRIVLCCAIAGIFGASMTFISGRASVARMAEMIGMLGTSGFIGMVLGTQLGDFLMGTAEIEYRQVSWMFTIAGLLGTCSMLFAFLATLDHRHPAPSTVRPPLIALLRRYHPGMVLLVGVAMGIGLGLPTVFLRTYAAELNITRISLFFSVYAPTAILTRVLTRRLPERLGNTPMILFGLGGQAIGLLLFLLVHTEWQLVLPGVAYGVSHAVLFPSVVAAGSSVFPEGHRGLATTLMLGTWDVGLLVGAPMAGLIVHYSGQLGLPAYPTMFVAMAGVLAMVGIMYGATRRRSEIPHPAVPAPYERRLHLAAEPARRIDSKPPGSSRREDAPCKHGG